MGEWIERVFAPSNAPDWALSSRERKSRESTTQNEQVVLATKQAEADKVAAEQKALQDTQEEDKKKASARLAASSSGFASGTNTARSFLTTF